MNKNDCIGFEIKISDLAAFLCFSRKNLGTSYLGVLS